MSYKLNSNLSDQITQLEAANVKISDAYDLLTEVRTFLDDGEWTGESQKVTQALCSILDIYHSKVIENLNYEIETLKTLNDDADEYLSSGKIPNEWS